MEPFQKGCQKEFQEGCLEGYRKDAGTISHGYRARQSPPSGRRGSG